MNFQGKYIEPRFRLGAFNCPICFAYSNQNWELFLETKFIGKVISHSINEYDCLDWDHRLHFSTAKCDHCKNRSFWIDNKLVYPNQRPIAPAHEKMDREIKEIYDEAASIIHNSPRSSCVLLRLALQRFLEIRLNNALGSGKIKEDLIKFFNENKMSEHLKKAMDSVRIIGNENSHKFDENDTFENSLIAFKYINSIYDELEHIEKLNFDYNKIFVSCFFE